MSRFLTLLAVVCLGCGGPAANSAGPSPEVALEELAEVIRSMDQMKQLKPTKLGDLKRYEPIAEIGIAALRDGSVVYLWGGGFKSGGDGVVAYETKAETDGGLVLIQDGTVKSMTAAEFASAPKAGKKS